MRPSLGALEVNAVPGAGIAQGAAATPEHPVWPVSTDFDRRVYCLLGLPFDGVTLVQAVKQIRTAAQSGKRCFFSTPNLNFLVGSRSDVGFRDSILRSDLSLADGMPLIWMAKMLRLDLPERVAGSSIYDALRLASGAPLSVYFFGGPEGAAQTAHEKLQASSGGLVAAGYQSPGFGSVEHMSAPEVLASINVSKADFVLVALGAKKGQAWIERNLSHLVAPVISHLGAVVNFAAGSVKRAPERWQKLGLEWLWRIREEPALWKRYAQDGLVLLRLLVTMVLPSALDVRLRPPPAADLESAQVAVSIKPSQHEVVMQGAWSEGNLNPLRNAFFNATQSPADIRLDMAKTTYVDSACIGLVLLLRGHQSKLGRSLRLDGVSRKVQRQLRLYGASFLLLEA